MLTFEYCKSYKSSRIRSPFQATRLNYVNYVLDIIFVICLCGTLNDILTKKRIKLTYTLFSVINRNYIDIYIYIHIISNEYSCELRSFEKRKKKKKKDGYHRNKRKKKKRKEIERKENIKKKDKERSSVQRAFFESTQT